MARIYLSSTYSDLRTAREKVYRFLRQMGHDVVAMEDYVAEDKRPLEKTLTDVAAADLYIGIFAWRYGYIPEHNNPEQRSVTELEYRRARELAKPCLIFLLSEEAPWPRSHFDSGPGQERIERLREELLRAHMVGFFSSADDLVAQIAAAVQNWGYKARRSEEEQRTVDRVKSEREETRKKAPPCIFLSYSHTDARWLSRLQVHLRVIERLGVIDLWSDTRIKAGSKWRIELRDAVNASNAAVFLLSADFLASEFIMTNELPPLLEAVEQRGSAYTTGHDKCVPISID